MVLFFRLSIIQKWYFTIGSESIPQKSGLYPPGGHRSFSHFNDVAAHNKQEMGGYQEHTGEDKSEMWEISEI